MLAWYCYKQMKGESNNKTDCVYHYDDLDDDDGDDNDDDGE